MHSSKLDIFFSCSFDVDDAGVNNFFIAICRALDLQLTNVATASALSPPEVAKRKIDASQGVVAICTRRSELKNGTFIMPEAVHDEISFAFGKDIPVLMLVEKGVSLLGFKSNFGTYLEFERGEINEPAFLEKAVAAVYELRDHILGLGKLGTDTGAHDAYAEYIHHLVELRYIGDDFTWQYFTTKKLVYTQPSKLGFSSGVWSSVPPHIPEEAANAKWELTMVQGSRGITLAKTVQMETPGCIVVILRPTPPAETGDSIEYSTAASSRYINPVWEDEVVGPAALHLDDTEYSCADGILFVHRTRKGIIEWRFAREYGFGRRDLVPFVASHTKGIDYEVESELQRADVRIDDFGGNLVVRMEIESPLPGHMYGIAWNPRSRPLD